MRPILFLTILLFAMPALAIDINGLPPPGTPIAAPADGVPNLADTLNEKLFSSPATSPMPAPPRANPNEPPLPPAPPPVTYTVWVYCWDGQQYVKQDDHTLQTMDIRKAASYWRSATTTSDGRPVVTCRMPAPYTLSCTIRRSPLRWAYRNLRCPTA